MGIRYFDYSIKLLKPSKQEDIIIPIKIILDDNESIDTKCADKSEEIVSSHIKIKWSL